MRKIIKIGLVLFVVLFTLIWLDLANLNPGAFFMKPDPLIIYKVFLFPVSIIGIIVGFIGAVDNLRKKVKANLILSVIVFIMAFFTFIAPRFNLPGHILGPLININEKISNAIEESRINQVYKDHYNYFLGKVKGKHKVIASSCGYYLLDNNIAIKIVSSSNTLTSVGLALKNGDEIDGIELVTYDDFLKYYPGISLTIKTQDSNGVGTDPCFIGYKPELIDNELVKIAPITLQIK